MLKGEDVQRVAVRAFLRGNAFDVFALVCPELFKFPGFGIEYHHAAGKGGDGVSDGLVVGGVLDDGFAHVEVIALSGGHGCLLINDYCLLRIDC